MKLYTTLEEKFCINANKNVAVETIRYADGTCKENCLNQHQCNHSECKSKSAH